MIMQLVKRLIVISAFLFGMFTVSANEKDYVLFVNSINMEEAWVKNFYEELEGRFHGRNDLDLKTVQLHVPILKNVEEVTRLQNEIIRNHPIPPKLVIVVGDPGWLVSAPLFDKHWKDIPVILCYSRDRIPVDIQTLLDKVPLNETNSLPIADFNKNYNVTVLRQPYYIREALLLIRRLQPEVQKIAFISDNRYISVVTRQSIQKVIDRDFPHLTLELLSSDRLSSEQLLDTLSTYDKTTGVIYYSWLRQYGNKNTPYLSDHIKKILPNFLEVPVYTLADLDLKENRFAGGHYISIKDFTDTTISVMDRILSGEKASSIPYQSGGTPRTYLNYADLQWCSIPETYYPSDAIYYYQPPTMYQRYKMYIWMTCLFLILLVSIYLRYHFRSINNQKELVKAKERAEESDRLKSAFLANMSHEIRTPLNAIVGFSSILAETADTPENREYIRIIENNNDLLLQLINDILDLSKIEAGQLEFNYAAADVNHALQELEDAFRLRVPAEVDYYKSAALEKCVIIMEKNRVMQILGNYLSNSIKHTTRGSITFGYYPPSNGVIRFYVRDTGCGIPADKHKDIFERFVKLDNFKQGTGLGLSICRMIAEKINAVIGVQSEVGKGSEFWLDIPFQPVEVA